MPGAKPSGRCFPEHTNRMAAISGVEAPEAQGGVSPTSLATGKLPGFPTLPGKLVCCRGANLLDDDFPERTNRMAAISGVQPKRRGCVPTSLGRRASASDGAQTIRRRPGFPYRLGATIGPIPGNRTWPRVCARTTADPIEVGDSIQSDPANGRRRFANPADSRMRSVASSSR